jgi:K+-transporting ATPase ATPase A chain
MNWKTACEIIFFFVLILVAARPFGSYMYNVFSGKKTFLSIALQPLESMIYKLSGVENGNEQTWVGYAMSLMAFNILGFILLFSIIMLQGFLPLNPLKLGAPNAWLAFNTAISFMTNTNWQAYTPETTMSYFTQMAGLAVQNFLSAATGIAVSIALVRGLVRKEAQAIGNFWVDMTRTTLYILLPISLIGAVVLVWQGSPQNFSAYTQAHAVEGGTQIIAQGPVASQEAIKELGTNGGGFFNANSAHPYENPTPLTNVLEMFFILLISMGLIFTFGKFSGDIKQGRALFYAVFIAFVLLVIGAVFAEGKANPLLVKSAGSGVSFLNGNTEGKETRFLGGQSPLFSVVTTVTSCGAVNNMHDSDMPLTGLIELFDIQVGELIPGGVGSGLYTLLLFAIITVFVAGLMVGRTPEYLGKKIGPVEIQLTVAAAIFSSILMLMVSAAAVYVPEAVKSVSNPGAHGFSQMLYAATSAAGNNGSAFAGLNANIDFWNIALSINMFFGRFVPMVLVLALAGRLASKKITPSSVGTLTTNDALFAFILVMIILLVGGLTFLPALTMGPIAEHMQLFSSIAH